MASGWPRNGSLSSSSSAKPRLIVSSAIAAANDNKKTEPRTAETRMQQSGLRGRQHLVDHLRIVHAALIHCAVDREHPQHPALRGRIVEARITAEAGQNRDILLSVKLVGHRRSVDRRTSLELPKLLSGLRIVGQETAALVAREDHAALGGEHSREERQRAWHVPENLLVRDVDRLEMADRVAHPVHLIVHALIDVAGLVLQLSLFP